MAPDVLKLKIEVTFQETLLEDKLKYIDDSNIVLALGISNSSCGWSESAYLTSVRSGTPEAPTVRETFCVSNTRTLGTDCVCIMNESVSLCYELEIRPGPAQWLRDG